MSLSGSGAGQSTERKHPDVGQVVGVYRLVSLLGSGGMGLVFEAEHIHLGRRVAIKKLRDHLLDDERAVEAFFEEARIANLIGHQNIVKVLDCVRGDDHAYMIMELLQGEDLAQMLRDRGRVKPKQALRIGRQVGSALAAAHDKGLVHQDVKPSNIFVCRAGPQKGDVKLLDFGVCRLSAGEEGGARGATGTPAYMAPERHDGGGADPRSDLYSLGVVLYEIVAGSPPYTATSAAEYAYKHIHTPFRTLAVGGPGWGPRAAFTEIVQTCLAKEPDDRYSSAAALVEAIERAERAEECEEPEEPESPEERERPAEGGAVDEGAENRAEAPGQEPASASSSPSSSVSTRPATNDAQRAIDQPRQPEPARPAHSAGGGRGAIRIGLVGGVTVLLLIGATCWWLSRREEPGATARYSGSVAMESRSAAASGTPQRTVRIRVRSEPAGAEVFRLSPDPKTLGVTPLSLRAKRSNRSWEVEVRREGYLPERLEIALDQDVAIDVPLSEPRPKASRDAGFGSLGPDGGATTESARARGARKSSPRKSRSRRRRRRRRGRGRAGSGRARQARPPRELDPRSVVDPF